MGKETSPKIAPEGIINNVSEVGAKTSSRIKI